MEEPLREIGSLFAIGGRFVSAQRYGSGHIHDTFVASYVVAGAETLDAMVDNLRPYGVREMVRTGRVAMVRGSRSTAVHEREPEDAHRFHTEAGRRPEEDDLPFVSK